MSEQTLPQRHPVTRHKTENPADGSPSFAVRGPAGSIEFDVLGNHVRVIDTSGEVIDAMGKAFSARLREYVGLGDDDAVFAVLADLYRTDLAVAPAVEPTNPDRFCRRCGATSGLKMLHSGLGYIHRDWECYDGCAGGAR